MPARSLHPTHPTAVDVVEQRNGSVIFKPRCKCGRNLGPGVMLAAGYTPRQRIGAFGMALDVVRRHERTHGVS